MTGPPEKTGSVELLAVVGFACIAGRYLNRRVHGDEPVSGRNFQSPES
jgi:hypothetical protein